MRKLFTTKMFLIISLPIVIVALCLLLPTTLSTGMGSYGINKTVGWAWDLSSIINWTLPFYMVYLLVYTALALVKIKTHYFTSVIHSMLIFVSFVFFGGPLFDKISFWALLLSPLFFIANLIWALINHKKQKNLQI